MINYGILSYPTPHFVKHINHIKCPMFLTNFTLFVSISMAGSLPPSPSPTSYNIIPQESALDFNAVVILAAVLCAIVCTLGLNSMLHCVVQCTHRAFTDPVEWVASRRVKSGLSKKDVMALPTTVYAGLKPSSPSVSSNCAICLADFNDRDEIRVLPKCNHGFHVACVDKWLVSNSSCPTCRLHLKARNFCPCSEIPVAV